MPSPAPTSSESTLSRRQVLSAALATVGAGSLAGCVTTTIAPPSTWSVANMENAPVMPKLDPKGGTRRTRVVVFGTEEAAVMRGANLHLSATAAIETLLGKGGIEIVDRGVAGKLDAELKLSEMKGSGRYNGPDVAEYAARVVMGAASWGSNFVEATEFKDKKGNVTRTPASYTHTGRSLMTIRIYEIPSLRLVQTFPVEGKANVTDQRAAATTGDAIGLMRAATENGIESKKDDVLNEFSPKGYVIEKRSKDKETIFRVMLGKQTGAKAEDDIVILTLEKNENPLTRQVSYDEVVVATGRLSNVVGDGESWVLVKDAAEAARVRRGDLVKVKHSSGLFKSLGNMLK